MAVLLNSSGEYLSRTATLPSLSTWSICAWVYFEDLADHRGLFVRGDVSIGGSDAIDCFWSAFGGELKLVIANDSGSDQLGSAVSAGTWYHVGYTQVGGVGTLYRNGVLDVTAAISVAGISADRLDVGKLGSVTPNHRFAYARVWDGVALSAAEFAAERIATAAVRTSNLYSDAPLAADGDDVSGNAKHWTVNGSVSWLAQPTIFTPPGVYVGMPFVRPAGVATLPLILRNPQNDTARKDYLKDGPTSVLKFGPNDYRAWFEALTDQAGSYTNFWMYATSPDGWTWTKDPRNAALEPRLNWENGEVCPDTWFWDPYASHYKMYYHGGNNAGPRQIGLMTSPTGLPGSWARANGGNPIVANGTGIEANGIADACVVVRSASDYRMIYKTFDGSNVNRLSYATSTDGVTWTKYGSNPILDLGSGNDAQNVLGAWCFEDATGRVHLWYCGKDASSVQRILYAYSSDWVTWTRNPSDVILNTNPFGGGGDPDLEVGDVVRAFEDDGLLFFTVMNFNFSAYSGDALGRLEGRGLYWLPKQALSTPARPARVSRYSYDSTRHFLALPTSLTVLDQTTFSIWCDFRCPPGQTFRTFYIEESAANKQVMLGLATDGTFGNGTGRPGTWYRTPTANINFTGPATRYDDNKWHRALFRRNGASSFDIVVDGVLIGTNTGSPSTDATTPTSVSVCGIDAAETANWPVNGPGGNGLGYGGTMMRRLVIVAGYAMTAAEELTLWNTGAAGGSVPGSGTLKLDLSLGNGGLSGPDTDVSSNAYAAIVTGPVLVDPAPMVASGSHTDPSKTAVPRLRPAPFTPGFGR